MIFAFQWKINRMIFSKSLEIIKSLRNVTSDLVARLRKQKFTK